MELTIEDLLDPKAVEGELVSNEKGKIIDELAGLMARAYPEVMLDGVAVKIREREKLGSTGIGDGVAIPHCKLPGLDRVLCCFGRNKSGVDFESVDDKPVHLFFMLIAPDNSAGIHLDALDKISKMCRRPGFRKSVMAADGAKEIYEIMKREAE